jgi:AcrR family transcriptional regulator
VRPERVARPQLDRSVVSSFKRRRIADALAELCIEQGFRATTIDHVARRAHVSRTTIYELFENREQIFIAVLDRAIPELFERTEAACQAAALGSRHRLEAGLGAVLAWVAEEPVAAWSCLVEALAATPESLDRYLQAIARFTVLLGSVVPAEVQRPKTTEESLVGGVASILSGLIRGGEASSAPELLPQLTVFLRGPFLATGPAPPRG